jgi:hypothetical protein
MMDINGRDLEVDQVRNDWALALMNEGVIVKITMKRWRGTASLKHSDLGLKFIDGDSMSFSSRYIKLGSQKLLPPEVLNELSTIERRARDHLNNYSFDTVWGRFVPFRAFDDWERGNEEIRGAYTEQAKMMGERYEDIVARVKHDYRSMGRDVWSRLYPNDTAGATESFLEDFSDRMVSKIPTREKIVASFQYDCAYFMIPMPSFIASDIAKADDIARESEEKDQKHNLAMESRRRIADEYINKKSEMIDGFLKSTVNEMRSHIGELCDNILHSMAQKEKIKDIRKNDIKKIHETLKKVELLNFHEDEEIEKKLRELKCEVDKFKGERDKDLIVDKLREIVDIGSQEFIPKNFNPSISSLEI